MSDRGDKALARIRAIHDHLDELMVDRRGGQVVRALWQTVADYSDKYLEATAAA